MKGYIVIARDPQGSGPIRQDEQYGNYLASKGGCA